MTLRVLYARIRAYKSRDKVENLAEPTEEDLKTYEIDTEADNSSQSIKLHQIWGIGVTTLYYREIRDLK